MLREKESNTAERELTISRLLNAPRELVWEVWTKAEHIKNWWGPTGFTNTIFSMDVKPGGEWDFIMHGPDGTDYKNKSIYKEIIKPERIVFEHVSPKFIATITFEEKNGKTLLTWNMLFETKEQFERVVKTFKADEGLKQNIVKLQDYLKAQFSIRNQLRTNINARVTTYLNFPGKTEEAFNFYKKIFKTEFSGKGIQRFGDIPAEAGHPPVSDIIKNMILHVELPIVGGHVLMATDAPSEMGFTLTQGNNMHICLEPETRKETKRLFDALSEGGVITMPLEDMFFGAYFGECTDKYGINWMFNFIQK
ncbi:MAG TPA: SRPBCC domain-containing protein [Chitinophagaceae bacterium]|nr:SRPBCC domain-containing protein [Chitinophagaceae bacterium]